MNIRLSKMDCECCDNCECRKDDHRCNNCINCPRCNESGDEDYEYDCTDDVFNDVLNELKS